MKLLIIASLVAACATVPASADPKTPLAPAAPKKPAPKASCMPTGTPIFESHKTVKTGTGPETLARIYDNGAWTFDDKDKDGKSIKSVIGGVCISETQLTDARAAIKAATWTVTTEKIKCMAMSLDETIYSVAGKEVFRDTLCSGKHLDDKSAAALATLKAIAQGPTPVTK